MVVVYIGCVLMFWPKSLVTVIWFLWAPVSFRSVIIENPIIIRRHIPSNRKSFCLSIQLHRDNVSQSEKVYPTQWNQQSQTNRRNYKHLSINNCSFSKKKIIINKWRMKDRHKILKYEMYFLLINSGIFIYFQLLRKSTQYLPVLSVTPCQSCINFMANSMILCVM